MQGRVLGGPPEGGAWHRQHDDRDEAGGRGPWRGMGGSIVIGVPMRVHLLGSDTEAPKSSSQEDALGGPEIGGSIESPPNRLPRELPPADEGAGQSLLKVRLNVEAAQPCRASAIPDDGKIVADDASHSLGRSEVRKQGEGGAAAHCFGYLSVVYARQGNTGMREQLGRTFGFMPPEGSTSASYPLIVNGSGPAIESNFVGAEGGLEARCWVVCGEDLVARCERNGGSESTDVVPTVGGSDRRAI